MNGNHTDEEAIFKVACQLASPDTREVYLNQVCGNNSVAFKRISALLRVHFEEANFLEASPIQLAIRPALEQSTVETLGSYIGPYKLIEQIGDGGMGVVYMAAQKEPVRRTVALKVIKAGMDTHQVVARFKAERQAMAMMNHPNIAKVLDAGATDAGRP